jgi:hypothetical protein
MPRIPGGALNLKIDPQSFRLRAEDALRKLGLEPEIGGLGALFTAAVAHGDISYASFSTWPYNLAIGLGNYTGNLPTGRAWKALLSGGNVLRPTPTPVSELQRVVARQPMPVITQFGVGSVLGSQDAAGNPRGDL